MNGTGRGHLEDGAILRILDAEPFEAGEVEHVEACDVCRRRAEELRWRTAALSEVLAGADEVWGQVPEDLWEGIQSNPSEEPPAGRPEKRGRRPRLDPRRWGWAAQAAAVAGILMAGGLAAEPVREWVRQAVVELLGDPVPDPVPAPATEIDAPAAVTARFIPEGPEVVLRLDSPQDAGTLTVRFEARSDAQGQIFTTDQDADLVVNPDGFRALNEPDDEWSYRFLVPEGLEGVTVWVAGQLVRTLPSAPGGEHTLSLGGL